ncbi:MAG: amidase family protein [Firmicutes bacterium]|nr:amidase family protein [Bacillota bacterium]
MKKEEMIKLSLLEAVRYIKKGEITARELLEATVKHIYSVNYNAILSLFEEDAFFVADKVDMAIAAKEPAGVLAGIPVIIKDNIDVAGYACTCGSGAFRANIAKVDADVVKKLKAAGAVILGKSNMDEFAMGSSNLTSAFGAVKNPFDMKRVPGGSSGGSACAVATHQCFFALGSDTGGSIRQPASYCGVVGLKPTHGSVSGAGCFPLAPSMDQIGPLTRTVGDCAAVFEVLALAERYDRYGSDFSDIRTAPMRVGVINESLPEIRGDVSAAFDAAVVTLKARGCEVREVSVPSFIAAHYIYKTVAFAEITQSMRTVGAGRELLGREVKKRVLAGKVVLDSPALLAAGLAARIKLAEEMVFALSEVDVIMLPTAPSVAFRLADDPSKREIKFSDMFTQPASIAGLPSLSVPFFKNAEGLPLGTQFVGKVFREKDIFAAGKLLMGEV